MTVNSKCMPANLGDKPRGVYQKEGNFLKWGIIALCTLWSVDYVMKVVKLSS